MPINQMNNIKVHQNAATSEAEMSTQEDPSKLIQRRVRDQQAATGNLVEELRQRDELWRKKYEQMLGCMDGSRVEQVMVRAGVEEYFDKMRARDAINKEIIQKLTNELDLKKRQVDLLQCKLKETEEQCIKYHRTLTEIQLQKDQLEAEKKAKEDQERERDRLLQASRSMNNLSSYASSIINDCDIPPPPPISMEEILGLTVASNLPQMRSSFLGTTGDYNGTKIPGPGSIGGASQKSKLSRSGSMRYPTTTTTTTIYNPKLIRSNNHNNQMQQY